MKKTILVFAIVLSVSKSEAQSISMESISSGGDTYTNPTSRLSFTSGQVMSGTYTNINNTLIEGFQQQYYTYWVGAISSVWTNQLNWNGGPVPGANTDIIILSGKPFYPLVEKLILIPGLRI